MRKTSILIICVIVVCAGVSSCALFFPAVDTSTTDTDTAGSNSKPPSLSIREQAESGYWIFWPASNQITVIGVSGILAGKEKAEIEAAKLDAARKISLFMGVEGKIDTVNASGPRGFFDHVSDLDAKLTYDEDYQKYAERLKFDPQKDQYRFDNILYIQFKYDAAMPSLPYPSIRKQPDGRPDWVTSQNLPQFEKYGYGTAVGRASKQVLLKDTISKSTDAAVYNLIGQVSTRVESGDIDKQNSSGGGGSASNAIHTISEGKISQFLVLEYYIEPGTGAVYTLAIAKLGK